jgi:hypothetical protein
MIVYNNKEYRNLVEQVQKNKADIEDWNSKEDTLANFGIRIIGKVASEDKLPEIIDSEGKQVYDYGDAFMVGSDEDVDYEYFVCTRPTTEVSVAHWQDIGSLSIIGPQGAKGDEGASVSAAHVVGYGEAQIEQDGMSMTKTTNVTKLTKTDGTSTQFTIYAFGKNGDKGDQGIQGEKGEKGDKGEKGEQGPQGEMGPTAPAYHIVGSVTSTSQLPDPTALKDLSAAYIIETTLAKQLYIQMGTTIETAKWEYLGDLDISNYWELSNKILAPIEAVDTVQIKKLAVLTSGGLSCASPSISGVASCSAINSPSSSLTLAGKEGVELSHNGTTVLKTNSRGGIAIPNTPESSVSEDSPILSERSSDNAVLKNSKITANGSTGALKATGIFANSVTTDILNVEDVSASYAESNEIRDISRSGQLVCGSTVTVPSGYNGTLINLIGQVFDTLPSNANVTLFGFGDTSLTLTISGTKYSNIYHVVLRYAGASNSATVCLMNDGGFSTVKALPANISISVQTYVQAIVSSMTDDGTMVPVATSDGTRFYVVSEEEDSDE